MKGLSKNIITHYAVIADDDEKIPLTSPMAQGLRDTLKNANATRYTTIPDINNPHGDPAWEGQARKIKIERVEQNSYAGSVIVCDFGNRHSMHEPCKCAMTYKIPGCVFLSKVYSQFPKVRYPADITPSIRDSVLRPQYTP